MKSVDKFFKDKLENHSVAPSENAWARVESNLSKKNNSIIWRIAAAVLLMGALISAIIWSQQNSATTNELAIKPSQKGNEKFDAQRQADKKIKEKNNRTLPVTPKSLAKRSTKSVNKNISVESNDEQKRKIKLEETETALAQQYTLKVPMNELLEQKEKIKEEATLKNEVASTKQKPIKLEFTLEDVASEAVATTNEAKNSGLKKVLELAREMKNGEGPVTSLRDKKNELFAHNFITGKTKVQ